MNSNGINPYDAPAGADQEPTVPRVASTRTERAVIAIAAIGFVAFGYLAIRAFLDRSWVFAFLAASASLMCIPWCDQTSPARARLALSLVMPFAVGGLACSVFLYFQAFHLDWFRALFNDKGSGPFGLIVAALAGLGVGGLAGWSLSKRLLLISEVEDSA